MAGFYFPSANEELCFAQTTSYAYPTYTTTNRLQHPSFYSDSSVASSSSSSSPEYIPTQSTAATAATAVLPLYPPPRLVLPFEGASTAAVFEPQRVSPAVQVLPFPTEGHRAAWPQQEWSMWNLPVPCNNSVVLPVMQPPPPRPDFYAAAAAAHHVYHPKPISRISDPGIARKRKTPHLSTTYSTLEYKTCAKKPTLGDIRTIRQDNRIRDGRLRTQAFLLQIASCERGKELLDYVESYIADRAQIVCTALVYFELAARKKTIRSNTSIRMICKKFMACLILAGKWLDDDHVENGEWSRRFNVSLKCVNKLERAICEFLDYDLSISQNEMRTVFDHVGPYFRLTLSDFPLFGTHEIA